MNRLKAGLVAVAGVAISVITFRKIRTRRASLRDEATTAADEAFAEKKEAADHVAAAAGHARVAGSKIVEYAREELDTADSEDDEQSGGATPVGRLRRAGKGWVRR